MKLFILFLLLAEFSQTTFLPLNITLVLIVVWSLLVNDRHRYIIALLSGILLGILSSVNIGFWAIVFLLTVKFVSLFKQVPVSLSFVVLPLSFLVVFAVAIIENLLFSQAINLHTILIETLLSVPIYAVIHFWEERFTTKSELKLRFRG